MQQRLVAMLARRLQLDACTTRASPLASATCKGQSLPARTATWAPHPSAAAVASSSALLSRQLVVACHARSRIDTSSHLPDLATALSGLPGSQQQRAGPEAALGRAAQQLGNRFFLVQCGQYHSNHPQAGQDAYALLQLVVVQVSPSPAQQVVPVLQPLEQQQQSEAVLTVLAYEVDAQHGPTGRVFSSPSAFLQLTNKRQQHNPLAACRIIFPGAAPVRLVTWYQQQLQPLGVLRAPPGLQHALRVWAHRQLTAAGFAVLPTAGSSSSRTAGDKLRSAQPQQQPHSVGPAEKRAAEPAPYWHQQSSKSFSRQRAVREGQHVAAYQQPSSTHLVAFTDGSCRMHHSSRRGNAVGAYAVAWPHSPPRTKAAPLLGVATSIRAEVQAAVQACQTADELDPGNTKTLVLYTDSMFLIQLLTDWMWDWAKHGLSGRWLASAGPDLVQQLYQHAQVRDMLLVKVKAHSGKKDWASVWNALADKLASQVTKQAVEQKKDKRRR